MSKKFETKLLLEKHTQHDHPISVICNVCEEFFHKSWILEKHMKQHTEEQLNPCDVCGKCFYMKWRAHTTT